MSFRNQRLSNTIKSLLGEIFLNEINNPLLKDIYIHEVNLTDDLMTASVYVSSLNHSFSDYSKVLYSARGFIKTKLSKKLRIKNLPQLEFYDSAEEMKQFLKDPDYEKRNL